MKESNRIEDELVLLAQNGDDEALVVLPQDELERLPRRREPHERRFRPAGGKGW